MTTSKLQITMTTSKSTGLQITNRMKIEIKSVYLKIINKECDTLTSDEHTLICNYPQWEWTKGLWSYTKDKNINIRWPKEYTLIFYKWNDEMIKYTSLIHEWNADMLEYTRKKNNMSPTPTYVKFQIIIRKGDEQIINETGKYIHHMKTMSHSKWIEIKKTIREHINNSINKDNSDKYEIYILNVNVKRGDSGYNSDDDGYFCNIEIEYNDVDEPIIPERPTLPNEILFIKVNY